jgi:hypothetical protein
MEPLLNYKGSFEDLDAPEQFALQLWEVPNISAKLKALICWDNFDVIIEPTPVSPFLRKRRIQSWLVRNPPF